MRLTVNLGERSYPIYIDKNILQRSELFEPYVADKKILIVSNQTIAPLYLEQLKQTLSSAQAITSVILSDGEQYKTMASIEAILDQAIGCRLNRSSLMIALGGGVVGDMTGFAAACYQRGIDFLQIPTTLLSQVDSSVGGKTGINHALGKNMIGAFHQPKAVYIDITTLKSLPDRELSAGLAEVIKYGLIADNVFFDWLEQHITKLNNKDPEALIYAIKRSCQLKAMIVAKDEKEQSGTRALLNLGHTFGHAIETLSGYGKYLHGEAVAIGMMMALTLSARIDSANEAVKERAKNLLIAAKLPVDLDGVYAADEFLSVMAVDKKNINGNIRLILLKSLGDAYLTESYNRKLMNDVICDFVRN